MGTAGTVPLSPLLGLTLPSDPILPGIVQLSWLLARDSPGDPTQRGGQGPSLPLLHCPELGLFCIFVPVELPEVG